MDDEHSILLVNEAFYAAFAAADFEAMIELWAHEDGIACTHPGWDVLSGYHDVMESWRAILEGPASPRIACRDTRVFVLGEGAFVICHEVVDGGVLVATNVFARLNGSWRMVHHHAGPCASVESAGNSEPTGTFH